MTIAFFWTVTEPPSRNELGPFSTSRAKVRHSKVSTPGLTFVIGEVSPYHLSSVLLFSPASAGVLLPTPMRGLTRTA